jgi:hypothetical protein
MRNRVSSHSPAKRRGDTRRGGGTAQEKPVALTLKVDSSTYVRLSTLRATQRRTNQDILQQALKEYLQRAGV